jgi:hypothetical protein
MRCQIVNRSDLYSRSGDSDGRVWWWKAKQIKVACQLDCDWGCQLALQGHCLD